MSGQFARVLAQLISAVRLTPNLLFPKGMNMAATNGVFTMNGNNFMFTLVFAQISGTNRIMGVMIESDFSQIHDIDGTCDGNLISFTRNMRQFGTTQLYVGQATGTSYQGHFSQSNMAGSFSWSAQLLQPADA
jgi:hypothetical protein